ncbi:MAG: adenosine deaminase [Terriglobales bacterium]
MAAMDSELRHCLRLLPKAELHIHLEGALNPADLLALSERHGYPFGLRDLAACRRLYSFQDFPGFIQAIKTASQHLITPEDYAWAVEQMGRRLAAQGIVYAEVFVSIGILHWKGTPVVPVWEAIEAARRELEARHALRLAWIFDAVRQFGAEAAERVLDEAISRRATGPVVAIGIGGDEIGGPAEWFTETFARARAAGIGGTAHAGETAGPESVSAALDALRVRRIGHALSAVRDPRLLARLAESEIYLDVCTMSNTKTGCWRGDGDHPVRIFDNGSVKWSCGSDDPGIFGSSLLKELYYCHNNLHLAWPSLRRSLRNGFLGAFLPAAERDAYLARFDAAWEQLRLPAS